jgi:tetratricopeptide (TPR) repeat protein
VDDTEQIEKYLAGELDKQALQAFEMRLQTDTVFAETFKLYQSIENEMTTGEDEEELRKNLSRLAQKHFEAKWWAFAAAVAASLTLLVIWKPWQDKVLSNQQVYAQNAVPDELPTIVRGNNDDTALITASELFNKKDYTTALPLLEKIAQQKPRDAQLQLSLGICYLQQNNYTLAIGKFDSLAAGQTSFKYDALFWKALTYLKQDKKDDCIAVLKQIPTEAKHKKAGKMLKELSKK